jgi:hypothetical protein
LVVFPQGLFELLLDLLNWDSNLGFYNSLSRSLLISVRDLVYVTGVVSLYFMYDVKYLSLKVVSRYAVFNTSFVILFIEHITSHVNQCFFASSLPIPWNMGILSLVPWVAIFDLELFSLHWLLILRDIGIDNIPFIVLLNSSSSSLISSLLSSSTHIFVLSTFLYYLLQMRKGGSSNRGFLHLLPSFLTRGPIGFLTYICTWPYNFITPHPILVGDLHHPILLPFLYSRPHLSPRLQNLIISKVVGLPYYQ